MGQGMDMETIYLREDKMVIEPSQRGYDNVYESDGQVLHAFTIGFCGQYYKCLEWNGECFYSYEKLDKAFADNGYKLGHKITRYSCYNRDIKRFFASESEKPKYKATPRIISKGEKRREAADKARRESCARFQYEPYEPINDFERYRAPIIVIMNHNETHINCRLRDYDFYKVKDPYTAYQEIFMWFVNVAEPEPFVPQMDDKVKIDSHGFNQWSFRKESSKKR